MTNELERITEIADKVIGGRLVYYEIPIWSATGEELLAFEQVVLAPYQQERLSQTERVSILEGKLYNALTQKASLESQFEAKEAILAKRDEEIGHLKAQLAMQAEVHESLRVLVLELTSKLGAAFSGFAADEDLPYMRKAALDVMNELRYFVNNQHDISAEDIARYKAEIEKDVLEELTAMINKSNYNQANGYNVVEKVRRFVSERGGVR